MATQLPKGLVRTSTSPTTAESGRMYSSGLVVVDQYVEKGTNSFGTATSWAAEVKSKGQTCRWRLPHHPLTAKGSSQSGLLMYIIITHEKEEQWGEPSLTKIMEINVLDVDVVHSADFGSKQKPLD